MSSDAAGLMDPGRWARGRGDTRVVPEAPGPCHRASGHMLSRWHLVNRGRPAALPGRSSGGRDRQGRRRDPDPNANGAGPRAERGLPACLVPLRRVRACPRIAVAETICEMPENGPKSAPDHHGSSDIPAIACRHRITRIDAGFLQAFGHSRTAARPQADWSPVCTGTIISTDCLRRAGRLREARFSWGRRS